MQANAITEAKIRLGRARQALAEIETAGFDFPKLETGWWQFLLAANAIYVKLYAGKKGHPRSDAWFGQKMHERKNDELLSYIHYARNSEEHGLDSSTTTGFTLEPTDKRVKVIEHPDGRTEICVPEDFPVGKALGKFTPPKVTLVRVYDGRSRRYFNPPTIHIGSPIDGKSPAVVARLAVDHLTALIAEAETYIVP
jgi:hypothetical protein